MRKMQVRIVSVGAISVKKQTNFIEILTIFWINE